MWAGDQWHPHRTNLEPELVDALWKACREPSDASILPYTDVDRSSDLDALWPLLAPLIAGHSDPASGTWLISTGSLWLLGVVQPDAAEWMQTGVAGAATVFATAQKFLIMKHLVFANTTTPSAKGISEELRILIR